MVQRLALARALPGVGQPDHAVEARDPREPVAARRLEAVHPAHAEPEQAHPITAGGVGSLLQVAQVHGVVESHRIAADRGSTSAPRSRPGNGSTAITVIDHSVASRATMSS